MFARDYGLIIACDVDDIPALRALATVSHGSAGVVGYKVGFSLALRFGLASVTRELKQLTDLPVIYDHQKAGTDIPAMGDPFAGCCAEAGLDGVILFPQAGPETMKAFVKAISARGMIPIVGGVMTHPRYLQSDGGYIADDAPASIYGEALGLGVTHFVLPGNKPDVIRRYASTTFATSGPVSLLMPGIGAQGGQVQEAFDAAKPHQSYAIVGSAIYGASDPKAALADFVRQVNEHAHSAR